MATKKIPCRIHPTKEQIKVSITPKDLIFGKSLLLILDGVKSDHKPLGRFEKSFDASGDWIPPIASLVARNIVEANDVSISDKSSLMMKALVIANPVSSVTNASLLMEIP